MMGSETPRVDAACAEIQLTADGYPPQTYEALCKLSTIARDLEKELTAANLALQEVREKVKEECATALESLPIDEASLFGDNKWQSCALVRKLAVLKVRSLP